jgi:hypothetical protein
MVQSGARTIKIKCSDLAAGAVLSESQASPTSLSAGASCSPNDRSPRSLRPPKHAGGQAARRGRDAKRSGEVRSRDRESRRDARLDTAAEPSHPGHAIYAI